MLQPETIERLRDLRTRAHLWLLMLVDLEGDPQATRIALVQLAEHLDAWRSWAEDLEKELTTP